MWSNAGWGGDQGWYLNKASGGGGGFSIVAGATALSGNTSATTIDFGTVAYPSGATRTVVAIAWYGFAITVTAVTVGGVSLTQIAGAAVASASGPNNAGDMWISSGPLSGSSGDVQVTFSAAQQYEASVALFGVTTTTPAPSAHSTNSYNSATSISTSLNIPAGGGGIFLATETNGVAITFTNATIDLQQTAGGINQAYGHTTTTGSGVAVSGSLGSNGGGVLSVVAWAP